MTAIDDTKRCYLFCGSSLILKVMSDGSMRVPYVGEIPDAAIRIQWQTITMAPGHTVCGSAIDDNGLFAGDKWRMAGLRDTYTLISEQEYAEAGKVWQILYWDMHSRFCPACARPMERHGEIMKRCPACGHEMYPAVSPAVIVRITRGDQILLVHARNFRGRFFGLVAGFVESGESLEQCVHREVMEETGLTIGNLHYFGSQTWPYPSNLMVGFTAEYVSGDIKLQDEELSAGTFYRPDNMPELPRKPSIARKLIDDWLDNTVK